MDITNFDDIIEAREDARAGAMMSAGERASKAVSQAIIRARLIQRRKMQSIPA